MENLAAVKDSLNKSENMTQQMLSILDAFGQRLCRLEETIMPIYEKTESLQRKHESILVYDLIKFLETYTFTNIFFVVAQSDIIVMVFITVKLDLN